MQPSTHSNPLIRTVLAAVAALSLGAAAACGDDGEGPGQSPPEIAYDGAHDKQLLKNVQDYDDQRVRISGEVRRVISPYAFTLGEPRLAPILVVTPDGNEVRPGDAVTVTGRMRIALDPAAVEKELGRDLSKPVERWGEDPWVMAESIGQG